MPVVLIMLKAAVQQLQSDKLLQSKLTGYGILNCQNAVKQH